MTDIAQATPSAVDLNLGKSTLDSKPAAADKKVKPERPNEEEYKKELAAAEKAHKSNMDALNAVKAKLDVARPNKDSPTAQKQASLRAEMKGIRDQQAANKSSRGNTKERLDSLDTQLKSRIQEQKAARSRVPYKNQEELDAQVKKLEKQVDSGTMKLVDEKKTLTEISNLKKLGKSFKSLDDAEKGISELKAQISEIKETMNSPEQKALSEKYSTIAKELDAIKADQDDAFKNLNSLRDERTTLQAAQQESFQAIRAIKDKYYQALNAARDWEREAHRQRIEKQKGEREAENKARRKKIAEAKLEEASNPAFTDEILTAEGLIRYFDPSTPAELKVLRGPSGFAAEAQRKVEDQKIQGTVLRKKEDLEENYFAGSGGKKGKKGKKTNDAADSKFNIPLGVIEELAKVNVEPPSSQAGVPATIEKLKAKVTEWKAGQKEQTDKNIAKAKAEIEKLEEEAKAEDEAGASRSRDDSRKVARKNAGVNGEKSATAQQAQEKDAVADAAEDLKKAAIEDSQS